MTCDSDDARELIGLAALGKLDADDQAILDAHLVTCPECREELAGLTRLTAVMAGDRRAFSLAAVHDDVPAAADLLLARARRDQRRRRGTYGGITLAAAAAVVVAVAVTRPAAVTPAHDATLVAGSAAPGASGSVVLTRAGGVTTIKVDADGLPEAAHCHLLVTSGGKQSDVFDWTASYEGEATVTGETGVRIAPGDVTTIVDAKGRQLLVGVARG